MTKARVTRVGNIASKKVEKVVVEGCDYYWDRESRKSSASILWRTVEHSFSVQGWLGSVLTPTGASRPLSFQNFESLIRKWRSEGSPGPKHQQTVSTVVSFYHRRSAAQPSCSEPTVLEEPPFPSPIQRNPQAEYTEKRFQSYRATEHFCFWWFNKVLLTRACYLYIHQFTELMLIGVSLLFLLLFYTPNKHNRRRGCHERSS